MNADGSDTNHEDEECVISRSGIEYSTRPIPTRRQVRNILTNLLKPSLILRVKQRVLNGF